MINSPVKSSPGKRSFSRYPIPISSTAINVPGANSSTRVITGRGSKVMALTISCGGYRITTAPLEQTVGPSGK
jgi:hypothetical protein